jgi:alcohol dehydrogenase class IV
VKVSLRSALMLPAVALIDPELTYSLPPDVTASTGLDAFTQCIEPFVSPDANPLTDAVAREGMHRAAGALRRVFHDGAAVDARHDMAVASLCGGLALANSKLGAVHGFAAPLGGMFPVPHGTACARLLPSVTAINVRALRARAPSSSALERYDDVARLVTGDDAATAESLADWLLDLVEELRVPRLSAYGAREDDIARVVAAARQASSMKGNPIVLTDDELAEAFRTAI